MLPSAPVQGVDQHFCQLIHSCSLTWLHLAHLGPSTGVSVPSSGSSPSSSQGFTSGFSIAIASWAKARIAGGGNNTYKSEALKTAKVLQHHRKEQYNAQDITCTGEKH